ncbi:MAG TPA: Stp1/IreP family PP2C-type Ser/Thr phosphatase [Burkholderiaceae bacterium]|jgi:serine/threonine protein phosphatase PrpC|nr:Stp1/IreP family PP2C-type Ser/Thr phosphatase [Burkholderiaceae bacterium]
MAYHVELQIAAKTDTGLVRSHNEDSIAHNHEYGLVILADGMGGYNAGEVASAIATSTMKETVEGQLQTRGWSTRSNLSKYLQQLLVGSVERANSAILEAARAEPQFSGMGTTVVAAVFHQNKLTVAHVGDSRVYRLRRGELSLITRDHSLLQEQIDAGMIDAEAARFSSSRNLITRAVGVDRIVDVEIHDHLTQIDDVYLICSDGLSDMLSMKEILEIMSSTASNLELACDALVARANKNGGRDNTSVILVTVQSSQADTSKFPERAKNWISEKAKVRWRWKRLTK